MLTLLAALLLSGPPAARAEDNPAPRTATVDAADENGDGTVSGRERRRKRRADRRARKAGQPANGAIETDVEMDAADAAESSARGSAASHNAASAAAAMKDSLPSPDAGGGLPGGIAQAGGAGGPAGGAPPGPAAIAPPNNAGGAKTYSGDFSGGASGDPGKPKTPSDFALAARSGYAPAFAAAGLKMSPDGKTVLRLDGRAATPEDYARLQREIGAMPAALGRRPDFFANVSPGHYADLKREYKAKKDGDPEIGRAHV